MLADNRGPDKKIFGEASMAIATHDVGRKLDALPLGRFHYRLTGLIVGGLFVDQFDNYITGGVLGAAIKEGWSTMSMNALFISAGTARGHHDPAAHTPAARPG